MKTFFPCLASITEANERHAAAVQNLAAACDAGQCPFKNGKIAQRPPFDERHLITNKGKRRDH